MNVEPAADERPLVEVGWVLAADLAGTPWRAVYERARDHVIGQLRRQLPGFEWRMPIVERRVYASIGALDPLTLLELGGDEKLHRGWDAALVLVPNELIARHRIATVGVPSSALEAAVLSSARLAEFDRADERLAAFALHVLGHIFGLEHAEEGPMRAVEAPEDLEPAAYPPDQVARLREALAQVSAPRIEEARRFRSSLLFYAATLIDSLPSIVRDVWGVRPWRMPVYLGRFTAAAAVSSLLFGLSSDAWTIGVRLSAGWIGGASAAVILGSTWFVYLGQNIGSQGRLAHRSEQLSRTRIVLFLTLLSGMVSLWAVVFAASLAGVRAVPPEVAAQWSGFEPGAAELWRYAAFLALVGVVGAALGGNLEDESEIKAELVFDEET